MKYVLVIGDGMADFPVEELSGKTPLQAAKKPVIDRLAGQGLVGEVRTVPRGVPAGSDTAILNIFGYDPRLVYTGRSPLEAAGSGVKMEKGNISFRCNLAAITEDGDEYEGQTMLSHSGGAIDGQDAMQLMNDLIAEPSFAALLEKHGMSFTVNPSYRHIAVLKTGSDKVETTPPHDILTRPIAQYLPKGEGDKMLREIMSVFSKSTPSITSAALRARCRPILSGSGGRAALCSWTSLKRNTATAAMRSRRCRWWRALRSWRD